MGMVGHGGGRSARGRNFRQQGLVWLAHVTLAGLSIDVKEEEKREKEEEEGKSVLHGAAC